MSDTKNKRENDAELDCEVTVQEGSHMTCDMIEEDPEKPEKTKEDYHI
ncbi:MAG: hypothetical protein PVI00_00845 [Desulfobacterales bacterium]|jgi:hypothetical protein